MKRLLYIIIGVTLLLLSCGNSNGGKNDVLIDGGHGIDEFAGSFGGFKFRLQRRNLVRHVDDAPQEEELQARDGDFIGPGEREESVFQKVVFRS